MNNRKIRINRRFRMLFILFFVSAFLCDIVVRDNPRILDRSSPETVEQVFGQETANLVENYIHTGVGAPWNATHYANRTEISQEVSFTNDSYGLEEIPLGQDWEGFQLNATIRDLTDIRNWMNGTFNFGADDGIAATPADDSADPRISANVFQNWSFGCDDRPTFENNMSGNYFDESNPSTDGRNALELKINSTYLGGDARYEMDDKCWWNSTFSISRIGVIDSELQFDIKPVYNTMWSDQDFNFLVLLNGETVYENNMKAIEQICGGLKWGTIKLPQFLWTNSSNIFAPPVENSPVSINFTLNSNRFNGYGFPTTDIYEQVLIANPRLILKCEATPSQVQLVMNATDIEDAGWGEGKVSIEGAWQGNQVWAKFNSTETKSWVRFNSTLFNLNNQESKIAFITDLALRAKKGSNSSYDMNVNLPGVKFSTINGSNVNWEAFLYVTIPTGYEETEMRLCTSNDVNITWISEPQFYNNNTLEKCDNNTRGLLLVPVRNISQTPSGFWHLMAVSPNYCNQLSIFKNSTIVPTDSGWDLNCTFASGDYINFTGGILESLPSGATRANLSIQFPNGTLWEAHQQEKTSDDLGRVAFDYFQIPSSPPEYEEGVYLAILVWYNSTTSGGCNATGIITRTFTVMHPSQLLLEQSVYSGVFLGSTVNLKVAFNDAVDDHAIRDAIVYVVNFTGGIKYLTEISPGYYLLEFNTTGGPSGVNNITIHARSSSFLSNQANVTITLRFRIRLQEAPEPPAILDLQVVQAFQVQFVVPEDADLMQSVVLQYWFDSEPGVHVVEMNKTSASTFTVNLVEFPADATLLEYTAIGTDVNGQVVPYGKVQSIQLLPTMPPWSMTPLDFLMAFTVALAAGIVCSRIYNRTTRGNIQRDPVEITLFSQNKGSSASGLGLALLMVTGTIASSVVAILIFQMAEVAMLLITGAFLSTTFLWVLALNARVIKSFKEKTPKLSGLPFIYLIGFGILAEILVLLWMGDAVPWWRVRVNQSTFSLLGLTIPQIVTTILGAFFTSILLLTRSIRVDVMKTVADLVEAERLNENPDHLSANRLAAVSRIHTSVAWKGVVFIGLIGMTIVLSSNLVVYAGQGLLIIGSFAIALLIPVLARRLGKAFKGPPMQEKVSDHVITCAACGKDTATSGTYCENCGGKLITGTRTKQSVYCTQCQRPNPSGAEYCRFCGTRLHTPE